MCYRLKSGRQLYIKKTNDSDTNILVNNHLLVISLYMSLSSIYSKLDNGKCMGFLEGFVKMEFF